VTLAEADAYVTNRVTQILRDRMAILGGIAESQNPRCVRPAGVRGSLPLARLAPPTGEGNCLKDIKSRFTMTE
jgi:hypothetical protein